MSRRSGRPGRPTIPTDVCPKSDNVWGQAQPPGLFFGQNDLQMAAGLKKSSWWVADILGTPAWMVQSFGVATQTEVSTMPPTAKYFLPVTPKMWIIFNQMHRMLNRRDDGICDAADDD